MLMFFHGTKAYLILRDMRTIIMIMLLIMVLVDSAPENVPYMYKATLSS